MIIIRAGVLGFCMGVRRAVELASAEAQSSAPVYTLGPLIHNPRVLADLENLGVKIIDKPPSDLRGCSLVIRAHGIEPVTEKELLNSGARIVDATCPKVKVSQLRTQELAHAGYCLFLAGEANHAEIKGILGFALAAKLPALAAKFPALAAQLPAAKLPADGTSFCVVAGNAKEAGAAARKLYKEQENAKTALIGQTTISEAEYNSIGEAIKVYFPNLEIIQTICAATKDRQQALSELLDKVDAVIIAGGRESANTRRLLSIASASGKPCALVEDASEIPPDFFSYERIGLSAGASTPDSVIDEIERELMRV